MATVPRESGLPRGSTTYRYGTVSFGYRRVHVKRGDEKHRKQLGAVKIQLKIKPEGFEL